MKRMWSEEEIQNLVEEQGGSGGGGKLYLHLIEILFDTFNHAYVNITTSSSEPFSKTTLADFIQSKSVVANGFVRKNDKYFPIFKISAYENDLRYYQSPLGNSPDNPNNFISMGDNITVTDKIMEA